MRYVRHLKDEWKMKRREPTTLEHVRNVQLSSDSDAGYNEGV